MKVVIEYRLSEAGRKADILAGGDGNQIKYLEVPRDNPHFQAVVEAGALRSESLSLDCNHFDNLEFDAVQTVEKLLAENTRRLEAERAKADQEAKDRLEATKTVLRERRTKRQTKVVGSECWEEESPAWPYGSVAEIEQSAEALSWIEELNAKNAEREAFALAQHEVRQAERRAAQLEAERLEAERRAALGLEENDLDLAIANGALTEVPIWESHKRGKNWLALIGVNPSQPGGLARDFAEKAKGGSYYFVPSDLHVGDAVEFGADYYSGGGRKNPVRWYGFVVRVTDSMLVLRKCDTGKQAVKQGEKFATGKPDDVAAAIEAGILRVNSEGAIVPKPSDN